MMTKNNNPASVTSDAEARLNEGIELAAYIFIMTGVVLGIAGLLTGFTFCQGVSAEWLPVKPWMYMLIYFILKLVLALSVGFLVVGPCMFLLPVIEKCILRLTAMYRRHRQKKAGTLQ